MLCIIQTDANQLGRARDAWSKPDIARNNRALTRVLAQPVLKAGKTAATEECFIEVRHCGAHIEPLAIFENVYAGPYALLDAEREQYAAYPASFDGEEAR